jgi:molybdate transport system substrate-binding protein
MRSTFGNFAKTAAIALTSLVAIASTLGAIELKVVTSGTFRGAYLALVPEYERMANVKLLTEFGASMGETYNAIPMRLNRGEAFDVVIMFAPALSDLIKNGKIRTDSAVDLGRSSIAMAVRAGAPKPDIGTVDALKRTLLRAKSIAYSDSHSGVYLSTELFPRLGIADQMRGKTRKVQAEPAGGVVARGEVEMGFQQLSELLPFQGIEIVGELPLGAQRITRSAAGIPVGAKHPQAAKALIRWLASRAAYAAIKKTGLQPAASDYK